MNLNLSNQHSPQRCQVVGVREGQSVVGHFNGDMHCAGAAYQAQLCSNTSSTLSFFLQSAKKLLTGPRFLLGSGRSNRSPAPHPLGEADERTAGLNLCSHCLHISRFEYFLLRLWPIFLDSCLLRSRGKEGGPVVLVDVLEPGQLDSTSVQLSALTARPLDDRPSDIRTIDVPLYYEAVTT